MFVFNCNMRLLLIFSLFISSCSSRENSQFTKANKVEITYYNNGDTLRANGMSHRLMLDIDKLLDAKAEPMICKSTGSIVFFINDVVVYGLEFSTDATGADDECQYLILQNKGWNVSYDIGMFLDETFNDLRKKNERSNKN